MRIIDFIIDDESTRIYNELDDELLEGVLHSDDTIKVLIKDNRLIDWYYHDSSKADYFSKEDELEVTDVIVSDLMFFIEQKHYEKYGN